MILRSPLSQKGGEHYVPCKLKALPANTNKTVRAAIKQVVLRAFKLLRPHHHLKTEEMEVFTL